MGAGPDNAAREAEANEANRRWQIQQTSNNINRVFDAPSRQAQYADFLAATRDLYKQDLDRKNSENNRQMKFSLARSGQTGGSVARDQGTAAGEQYQRGLIEADRLAQGQEADLRSQDEQARSTLLSMAQQGLDSTTAASQAASAMRNNLQAGQGTSMVKGIGDIFGQFGDAYTRSRQDAERRRGEKYSYQTIYQPGNFTAYGGGQR